MTKQLYKVY